MSEANSLMPVTLTGGVEMDEYEYRELIAAVRTLYTRGVLDYELGQMMITRALERDSELEHLDSQYADADRNWRARAGLVRQPEVSLDAPDERDQDREEDPAL